MTPEFLYGKIPEILIVDDTIDSLRLLSESLSRHGYDVRSVTNGTFALSSVQAAQPDLILLDIRMPDLSGYEVCQQLKENPQTYKIPVIFISALHESFDKVKAFEVGGVDYITKPFHIEEVLARIQSQLALSFSLAQTQILNEQLEQRVQERTAQLTLANQALQQEISERKQIEQSLRESEAKFHQISENIQEVFWLINYDAESERFTQIEYVSSAYEKVWGRTCESLYQNPQIWINAIHPDDRPWIAACFMDKGPRGFFNEEYRIIRPDGTSRWIHNQGFPIRNHEGHIFRLVGIAEDITERKKAEQERDHFFNLSLDLLSITSLEGYFKRLNPAWEKTLGYTIAELQSTPFINFVHPEDQGGTLTQLKTLAENKTVIDFENRYRCKDGSYRWLSWRSIPIVHLGIVYAIARDVTEQKQVELERDRFFSLSLDLLFIANKDGVFKRLNPAWKALGYNTEELLGTSLWAIIHPDDRHHIQRSQEQLSRGKKIDTLELRCRCQDGSYFWIAWNLVPFLQESLLYGAGRNVSQRKASEALLVHANLHDSLTGLANRVYFMEQLKMAIKKKKRNFESRFAVLFIDLDNFKSINDTLGHQVGDQLLIQSSQVLKSSVRDVDSVARLGGDEFIILLEEVKPWQNVLKIVERIQTRFRSGFQLGQHHVFTNASIGIVFSTSHQQSDIDAIDIIRDADIAMYRAKANGKDRYEIFDEGMYAQTLRLVELENDLRQAIAQQQLHLHYQPIVSLQEGVKVQGFEVLLRWYHPQKGVISPSEFIPIAESTGQINGIGEWLLQQACIQFQEWCSVYPDFEKLYFSVNVSGRQLRETSLLNILDRTLAETGIPAHCLKLEITESSLIKNTAIATQILQKIQNRGIKISLDDFGTGFSSLKYLHQFPINIIKIDRAFVNSLNQGTRERSIIRSIVTLARSLGFKTVAEGIETCQQLEQLQELGCESGQGYLFSKPMSQEQVEDFLGLKNLLIKSDFLLYVCQTEYNTPPILN